MGMRIGNQSAASAAYSTTGASQWQQRQQGVKDLFAALKAGDLGAAQKAYATLTPAASTGSSTGAANGPLAQIGQALQNGDIAGAQQAAQALQAARDGGGHGHHHHHAGATPPVAATSNTGGAGTGSVINLTA